jgi:DNA topoisomerase-2
MTDQQRQYVGVIPLKGKVMNVYGTRQQEPINEELKIIGSLLRGDKKCKYRYGYIVIMTDQDHDGAHIKGLIINAVYKFWPWFVQNNRIKQFITPVVRVTVSAKNTINFYTEKDYKQYVEENNRGTAKYYKGLGTSTQAEG